MRRAVWKGVFVGFVVHDGETLLVFGHKWRWAPWSPETWGW